MASHIRPPKGPQRKKLLFSILFLTLFGMLIYMPSLAQRVGEQAEMDRLEQQADNLAAQNDPEGAALAIGKAAMMADLLTRDSKEPQGKTIYQAAAHLFRGQELGLRALALFDRAGGQAPASAGVCHYLVQGNQKLHHSKTFLEDTPSFPKKDFQLRQTTLLQKNEEWKDLLQDLHEDFACDLVSK
jgi:hypothetical protein